MKKLRILLKHLVLGAAAFIGLIPFLLVFVTSIKPPRDAIAMPPRWIFIPTLVNYAALLGNTGFMKTIANSLIIATTATVFSTVIGILAGYAFTRFRFRGSGVISYFILFLRLVPPVAFIIPYFLIWKTLGLSDTYLSMILMYMSICLPLLVWMMRSFFMEVPVEIEEAALVDGCSRWRTLRMILIPAVLPGILRLLDPRVHFPLERVHARPHQHRQENPDPSHRNLQLYWLLLSRLGKAFQHRRGGDHPGDSFHRPRAEVHRSWTDDGCSEGLKTVYFPNAVLSFSASQDRAADAVATGSATASFHISTTRGPW